MIGLDDDPADGCIAPLVPQKYWFSLRECCALKGLNYKTACNRPYLQPNKGKTDGRIGGKKMWKYHTLYSWLTMSDSQIVG
ncbi:MAG: hypothetical protein SPD11_03885 [Sphaerochaetaceae bacterium]|nr:hypothetical protein [Sphaerochaetaceae bacterium]